MNILYVVNDFFPLFYGGVERYVLNISKQMQRMGHAVKVLTYGMDDKERNYQRSGDILFKNYAYENVPVISVRHVEIPSDIGYRIFDDMLERNLYALLKHEKIEILHIAHPMKFSPIVDVAKQMRVPVVLTLTDFWLLCPRGRFYKPDYTPCNSPMNGQKCIIECGIESSVVERYKKAREIFRKVDRIVAPSQFIIDIFRNNGWRKKITLVRHGVDYGYVESVAATRRKNGPVILGYTGLITKFKGVDLLIESFKRVKNDKLSLLIYGDVYKDWVWEKAFFDKLKRSIEKDSRIKLMGKYTHNELPKIFNMIDINIIPSTTLENYGLVVIESLSHNVPVIVSDIVGSAYEYVIDGVNGFVFPVNNPESLTEIIERIANNPPIIDRLRQNIVLPPRIEEEAFMLEGIYKELTH
jgi:glycosyltransferase involved in cell wall biosynthesis